MLPCALTPSEAAIASSNYDTKADVDEVMTTVEEAETAIEGQLSKLCKMLTIRRCLLS